MKAETAYNVILALPQQEVERLYKMLGVVSASITTTKKAKKETANLRCGSYRISFEEVKETLRIF